MKKILSIFSAKPTPRIKAQCNASTSLKDMMVAMEAGKDLENLYRM